MMPLVGASSSPVLMLGTVKRDSTFTFASQESFASALSIPTVGIGRVRDSKLVDWRRLAAGAPGFVYFQQNSH